MRLFNHNIKITFPEGWDRYLKPGPSLLAFTLVLLAFVWTTELKAQTTPVNFTFNLSVSAKTSAGVYLPDGTLIRTLWSGVDYTAGAHTKTWDKKDDNGNLMSGLNYQIKVVSNNVTYSWDGVVGNTSDNKTGNKKIRHLRFMWDVAFAGTKGYYCTEFVEGNSSANKFQLSNIQSKDEVTPAVNHDVNLAIKSVATDGNYVYWTGYDAYGSSSFTYATKVSDESEVMFSSGSSVSTQWGRTYPKAIDIYNGANNHPTSVAVQKSGNYLFISHVDLDLIKIFNKTSGALVTTHSISKPRDLTTDVNGDLWVISGTNSLERFTVSSSNGSLTQASSITGLVNPISVSSYNSYLAVIDESTSQVKCFDISNNSAVWTLGQKDGYKTDATVTTDKFYFNNNNNNQVNGFVSFGLDGSIWVGDPGNCRLLHYSASRIYIEQIMYMAMNYNASVNTSDPTRVFCDFLEFKVDYSKPLGGTNGSWTLVKNWGHGLGPEYLRENSNTREVFKNCVTLSNGKTYATIEYTDDQTSYRYPDVVELVEGGKIRLTGIRLKDFSNNNIDPVDGTLRYIANNKWYERKLTGFSNDNPVWATATVVGTASTDASAPASNTLHNPVMTSSNMLVLFDRSYTHSGFHLAAVKKGSSSYAWKTSPSTTRGYTGAFPNDGTYDIGNGVEYAGGQVYSADRSIFWNYIGEFWKNSQTNKWNHYYDNGLFINQFGLTTIEAEKLDGINSPRMAAGNAFAGGMVKVGSDYYIYHCDESVHGGTHRWKVTGLNTIKEEVINLNTNFVEINVKGNSIDITKGANSPSTNDNTDFGSTGISTSVTRTFVIENTGTSDLSVTGITISGTNAGDFAIVSAPGYPLTVTAGNTYTITVKFTPSAAGTRNAMIVIANSDPDEDSYNFAIRGQGAAPAAPDMQVTGNGVNISDGDVTPNPADNTNFGSVLSGDAITRTFVIKNAGNASLSVTACSFTGTNANEFELVNPPSYPLAVATAGTYTITIKYTPAAAGTSNAVINLSSNDANKAVFNFALEGNAQANTAPILNIQGNGHTIAHNDMEPGTADNTDFGTSNPESFIVKSFVIQNLGTAPLLISSCNFTGDNASDFSVMYAPSYPLTVAPNGTYAITVKFAPAVEGKSSAVMTINSDDQANPVYSFAIQGTAQLGTGINEVRNSFFTVYPNPGNGIFNIRLEQEVEGILEVYNTMGSRIYAAELSSSIDLGGNAAGIYYIVVRTEAGTYTQKITLKP